MDEEQQHTDAEIDQVVEEVKEEILHDMGRAVNSKGEIMPASVSTYSELHDYVDANEYGGFTDPASRADWSLGDIIAMQEKVDAWLQQRAAQYFPVELERRLELEAGFTRKDRTT